MGKKGGNAPSPDPNIGIAALRSAELGEDYLAYMKDQAKITNAWAEQDRSRERGIFQPLQDKYIARAEQGPDYKRVDDNVRRATADTAQRFSAAQDQQDRRLASMGVDPRSGRFDAASRGSELAEAAATAGAANTTRLASRAQEEARNDAERANAINMGAGLAVNPGTSMGLSNGAVSSGFSGAMQGQNQKGSLLNTQYQQQMSAWQADQAASSSLWGGLGGLAGLALVSSKDAKENKKPVERSLLDAVEKMPVEQWDYKPGMGDGGSHVGPYAEDFQKETGRGDGKTINVVDAIGVTMGAIKELSAKVDSLASSVKPRSIMGAE